MLIQRGLHSNKRIATPRTHINNEHYRTGSQPRENVNVSSGYGKHAVNTKCILSAGRTFITRVRQFYAVHRVSRAKSLACVNMKHVITPGREERAPTPPTRGDVLHCVCMHTCLRDDHQHTQRQTHTHRNPSSNGHRRRLHRRTCSCTKLTQQHQHAHPN